MKKLVLLISILNVVLFSGCSQKSKLDCYKIEPRSHFTITPLARGYESSEKENRRWLDRHADIIQRLKENNPDLIFIGDSITDRWKNAPQVWQKYYGHRNAVNMGIGGDGTQNILWRLEDGELDGISPRLVILMAGVNNIHGGSSVKEVADGVIAICKMIRKKLPTSKILILGILPSASDYVRNIPGSAIEGGYTWKSSERANEIISEIADNNSIYYLNINKVFLNSDGTITRDMMPDLVHLSPKGYEIWARTIEPMVKELLED